MKKTVFMKGLFFLFILLTIGLFSCKDNDKPDFKSEREDFMGKNSMQIVLPVERDTINFSDTTSGVVMSVKGQELLTVMYEVKDTVSFLSEARGDTSRVKRDFRIVVKYKNFHISGAVLGRREFGFDATAMLYLNKYQDSKIDTIPLKYIPITGNITGNKMSYAEDFIPDENFAEPYIMMRYKGSKIRY